MSKGKKSRSKIYEFNKFIIKNFILNTIKKQAQKLPYFIEYVIVYLIKKLNSIIKFNILSKILVKKQQSILLYIMKINKRNNVSMI